MAEKKGKSPKTPRRKKMEEVFEAEQDTFPDELLGVIKDYDRLSPAEQILVHALEYIVRMGPSYEEKDQYGNPETKGVVSVRTYPAEEKKVYGQHDWDRTEYTILPSFYVTYQEKDCPDCGGEKGCFKISGGWPRDRDRVWNACTIAQIVKFFVADGAGNLRGKKQTVGLIGMNGLDGYLYSDLPGYPRHNALEKGYLLSIYNTKANGERTGDLPEGF